MSNSALFFTIFYMLMSACFILPPNEFVSLGLTVQHLFSNWLGSENEFFIQYHIRRTVITMICHSLLPLGYLFGLSCTEDADVLFVFSEGSIFWHLFLCFSVMWPVVTMSTAYLWYNSQWKQHPVAKTLQKFSNQNSSWTSVASDINREFRRVCVMLGKGILMQIDSQQSTTHYSMSLLLNRLAQRCHVISKLDVTGSKRLRLPNSIDKICIETNCVTKVIATDNWIIKVLPYWLEVAHQSDAALILSSSDTHTIAPSSAGGVQYLNIEVKSTRAGVKPFCIRLNALDFRDLQDKVSRPITVLQNVTFHRTLIDKFLDAFKEQIAQNPVYEVSEVPEMCFGCMQTQANVKLQKLCTDVSDGTSSCSTCYCRPMWCVDCMGKWFASRQDQNKPDNWLGSKCTCPICRAEFCMLDVCKVSLNESL